MPTEEAELASRHPLIDDLVDAAQDQSAWRRSVLAFLTTLLVCLGVIAALNYFVNPLGLFRPHLLPAMVWNGRAEKMAALAEEQPKPEILVLGSSHVWAISPAKLQDATKLPAFNLGVSVAMAEDNYALLRYAVEHAGVKPKVVILGLDVEALHNGRPIDPRTQQVSALREYLPRERWAQRVERWKPLLTMQSTELSVKSVRLAMAGRGATPPDPMYTVGAHGDTHLTGVEQKLARGQSTRAEELQKTVAIYKKRLDQYTALSRNRMDYLQKTLSFCKEHEIRVVVFLTPLHPQLRSTLASRGYEERRAELLARVPQMVRDAGGEFVDYSDVASFGGSAEGFLDGAHLDDASGTQLTEHLLKETHALQ